MPEDIATQAQESATVTLASGRKEPFGRIAMDIVGPFLKRHLGKRHVPVNGDYATRYPEAVAS